VTEQGVATDPAKVERLLNWPIPESFLGLASYYRRFVPVFGTRARPLYQLTESIKDFEWTNANRHLITYPKQEGLFILDTDASNPGVGAVLSKLQDGVENPIANSSRALSRSERNYCTSRRELVAIVEFT